MSQKGVGTVRKFIQLFFLALTAGVLAAIALPNFLLFNKKARYVEALTNLASIHAAQEKYHQSHGRYAENLEQLNWTPRANSEWKYSYIMAREKKLDDLGLQISVSENAFTAAAVGNIDRDEAPDVWIVNQSGVRTHLMDDIRQK